MARPKADLPAPEALRALVDGEGRLAVRVTPGAKVEGISIEQGRVSVKVRAKPEDGKATTAVLALVAAALEVAPSKVELLRGATSREKLLRVPPSAV
ncbi:DUF167 domain-containing protein [Novosphingobium percolationis]|uniref:DUF167 domain-containing protein n=1 Tax=Novosphingobium percolationis TaxID=2871811 RepID=UPI001CD430CD|nr:DUF167 domain-containing protein [Novosphingobium percolationis]